MSEKKTLKQCMAEIATKATETHCPHAEAITHFNSKAQQEHIGDNEIIARIKREMHEHLSKRHIDEEIKAHISEECLTHFAHVLGYSEQPIEYTEGSL